MKRENRAMVEILKHMANGNLKEIEKQNKVIKSIEEYYLMISPVKSFDDDNDDLVKIDLGFEILCASLEEAGVTNPKSLSTYEFEAKINYFNSKKK